MVDFKDVSTPLTPAEAFKEAGRCLSCPKPRCRLLGCPAGIDIPGFIKCLKVNDVEGAYKILMEYSNLSPICSRICDHEKQCVGACILNFKKQPIAIGALERFVQDNKKGELEPVKEWSSHSVGILGSGPAGISCALELVKHGIHAEVYEKEKYLGGILSYGIPEYRLPKKVVEDYLAFTKRMGVVYHTESKPSVEELLAKHDFVFLGIGLGKYKSMGIPGEMGKGVLSAGDFLKEVNLAEAYHEGQGVHLEGITYVVGGGNVAMDACRTSVRVGSKETHIVYRRSLEEAPAAKAEIADAQKEGVIFNFLHNPVEVILSEGKVTAIKCEVMVLGEPDASGRRSPVGTGTYETYPCDNLIMAIGQGPAYYFADSLGLTTNHGYLVCPDGVTTSNPKIYAGGDIVRGADTVVRAMGDGKLAASKMIERLEAH